MQFFLKHGRGRSWISASDKISISDKDDRHPSERQYHRSFSEPGSSALECESQLNISGRRNSILRSITTSFARAFGMYENTKGKTCVHIKQKIENMYTLCRVKHNFKIGSVIGKGSYATVRKIIRRTDGAWDSEIQVKKTLIYDHPYCLRIERVYETRKQYLIVMEYCSIDLHEALAQMEQKGKPYSQDRWRWSRTVLRKPCSISTPRTGQFGDAAPLQRLDWRHSSLKSLISSSASRSSL
eukprot:g41620.t1